MKINIIPTKLRNVGLIFRFNSTKGFPDSKHAVIREGTTNTRIACNAEDSNKVSRSDNPHSPSMDWHKPMTINIIKNRDIRISINPVTDFFDDESECVITQFFYV